MRYCFQEGVEPYHSASILAQVIPNVSEHMFEDLFDEYENSQGDLMNVRVAACAAAAVRTNGRRGVNHHDGSVLRLQLSFAQRELQRQRAIADRANAPLSFSKHVARVCFADHSPNDIKIINVGNGVDC